MKYYQMIRRYRLAIGVLGYAPDTMVEGSDIQFDWTNRVTWDHEYLWLLAHKKEGRAVADRISNSIGAQWCANNGSATATECAI